MGTHYIQLILADSKNHKDCRYDAIEHAAFDPAAGISEQNRFLLRELQALMVDRGLVDSDDVVVVAARFAFPEYRNGLYICRRSVRSVAA